MRRSSAVLCLGSSACIPSDMAAAQHTVKVYEEVEDEDCNGDFAVGSPVDVSTAALLGGQSHTLRNGSDTVPVTQPAQQPGLNIAVGDTYGVVFFMLDGGKCRALLALQTRPPPSLRKMPQVLHLRAPAPWQLQLHKLPARPRRKEIPMKRRWPAL